MVSQPQDSDLGGKSKAITSLSSFQAGLHREILGGEMKREGIEGDGKGEVMEEVHGEFYSTAIDYHS